MFKNWIWRGMTNLAGCFTTEARRTRRFLGLFGPERTAGYDYHEATMREWSKLSVGERWMFLGLAVALLMLGSYAILNPRAVKRENADGPYFRTGFARMPLWLWRVVGVITVGVAGFFV